MYYITSKERAMEQVRKVEPVHRTVSTSTKPRGTKETFEDILKKKMKARNDA